jgi:hypothetical protein
MAYGQIDPARLNGDALAPWHLRSHGHRTEASSGCGASNALVDVDSSTSP